MKLQFLSKGPPGQVSGGYLYNRYLIDYLQRAGVDVTYHSSPPDLMRIRSTDVIVVDSLVLGELAAQLLSLRARLILLLHLVPDFASYSAMTAFNMRCLLQRSKVIVTGAHTAELVQAFMTSAGFEPLKIEPGIPANWRRKTSYAEHARSLLGVANYVPGKGITRMLDVLGALRHIPWTLTLHGNQALEPDYFRSVARLVETSGLENRVELLGPVEHCTINERMCEADLLLHFSHYESYSMVTAEAIACGLPVVSYRTGNSIVFGRSGLVHYFGNGDASEAAALGLFMSNATRYAELRRRPGWQIRTWQDVGQEFLSCLDQSLWTRMSHA
jgi:glycosyltransferase involved in cell wall biosynthesis